MIKDINNIQILVITDDEYIKNQAIDLNVNYVLDSKTAISKINAGWNDFDIVVITPEMMGKVGCLGKYLGPQGKMPCPKCDTVVSKNRFPFVIDYIQRFSNMSKPNPANYTNAIKYRSQFPHPFNRLRVVEYLIDTIFWDYWNNVNVDEVKL